MCAVVLGPHVSCSLSQLTEPDELGAAGSASCRGMEETKLWIDWQVGCCREKPGRQMYQKASTATLHTTFTATCVRRKLPTILKMVLEA